MNELPNILEILGWNLDVLGWDVQHVHGAVSHVHLPSQGLIRLAGLEEWVPF